MKQETIHYNFVSLLTNKHHGGLNFFKAKGCSARQEIPCPSQNLWLSCSKDPPVMLIISQTHPVHTSHWHQTPTYVLLSQVISPLQVFYPKLCMQLTISHKHVTWPTYYILLYLMILKSISG